MDREEDDLPSAGPEEVAHSCFFLAKQDIIKRNRCLERVAGSGAQGDKPLDTGAGRTGRRGNHKMDIEFRKVELEDQEILRSCLWKLDSRSAETTYGNIYLWSRRYPVVWAMVEGMLVIKTLWSDTFTIPAGDGDIRRAVDALTAYVRERGERLVFHVVTQEQYALLEQLWPGRFAVSYDRDYADYVYETQKLAQLSGKKYHGKKNHVNKFLRLYPDWSYERITKDNLEECFQMALRWRRENGCEEDAEKNAEMCVAMNALRLYEELGFLGGLLRVNGEVVAFTLGEPACQDTFVVHIEKARGDIEGAYTMINQQFVEHELLGRYPYTNREDDAGEEGLRRAKLSYHPAFMIEKGYVSERTDER